MGRAARWLRNLWSGSKKNKEPRHSTNNGREHRPEKKRWSFRKSRDSAELALGGHNASTASSIEAAWFQSLYAESDKERSKHAIAVAAAAAADAAVAAAEAAVAAVRLAGKGTGGVDFAGSLEQLELAAERIQTAFRGYLARKARRALKALVKLQALVRGYLVRKQVAATLHGMQALVRAQATIRAQKCRSLLLEDSIYFPEIRHRRSLERFTDPRSAPRRLSTSVDGARGTKTVEIDTYGTRPCQVPPRISIPSRRVFEENHDYLTGEKCRVSATAHSTPRCVGPFDYVAVTPAKSVCVGEGVFRQYSSSPSYVINTKSSMAKQRPQSEVMRKRQPLSELTVDARAGNLGGNSKLHKNGSLAQEAVEFKRAVVGKLEREIYLQRKW